MLSGTSRRFKWGLSSFLILAKNKFLFQNSIELKSCHDAKWFKHKTLYGNHAWLMNWGPVTFLLNLLSTYWFNLFNKFLQVVADLNRGLSYNCWYLVYSQFISPFLLVSCVPHLVHISWYLLTERGFVKLQGPMWIEIFFCHLVISFQ